MKIVQTKPGKGTTSAGSPPPKITAPRPQTGSSGQPVGTSLGGDTTTPQQDIENRLALAAEEKPAVTKTYVVASDMTSEQEKDRKLENASRL